MRFCASIEPQVAVARGTKTRSRQNDTRDGQRTVELFNERFCARCAHCRCKARPLRRARAQVARASARQNPQKKKEGNSAQNRAPAPRNTKPTKGNTDFLFHSPCRPTCLLSASAANIYPATHPQPPLLSDDHGLGASDCRARGEQRQHKCSARSRLVVSSDSNFTAGRAQAQAPRKWP